MTKVLGMIIAGKCPKGAIPGPGALKEVALRQSSLLQLQMLKQDYGLCIHNAALGDHPAGFVETGFKNLDILALMLKPAA